MSSLSVCRAATGVPASNSDPSTVFTAIEDAFSVYARFLGLFCFLAVLFFSFYLLGGKLLLYRPVAGINYRCTMLAPDLVVF